MLIIDTREKPRAIGLIVKDIEKAGIDYKKEKLDVGDYMNTKDAKLVIDRKQNLLEVANNVGQDHRRFLNEIKRAEANGVHIIFLVEHGYNIASLKDVQHWINPRLKESPLAISGQRLYEKMLAIQNAHDIEWRFCIKKNTGKQIIKILNLGEDHGEEEG